MLCESSTPSGSNDDVQQQAADRLFEELWTELMASGGRVVGIEELQAARDERAAQETREAI